MPRQIRMADSEDAAMEAMQPAAPYCTGYGAARVAQRPHQLPNRDHAVLPRGQICQ